MSEQRLSPKLPIRVFKKGAKAKDCNGHLQKPLDYNCEVHSLGGVTNGPKILKAESFFGQISIS